MSDNEEDWPEFEEMKDSFVNFMSDLPIEVYEKYEKLLEDKAVREQIVQVLLKFNPLAKNEKDCQSHCPKCGAGVEDVDWGLTEVGDNSCWQSATCNKCGCEFREVSTYAFTETDEPIPTPMDNPDE